MKHVLIWLNSSPTKFSSSFIPDTYALAKLERSSWQSASLSALSYIATRGLSMWVGR